MSNPFKPQDTITLGGPCDGEVWKINVCAGDTIRIYQIPPHDEVAFYRGTGRHVRRGLRLHHEALYIDPEDQDILEDWTEELVEA